MVGSEYINCFALIYLRSPLHFHLPSLPHLLYMAYCIVKVFEAREEKRSRQFFKNKIFGKMERQNAIEQRRQELQEEEEMYGDMPGLE